jgi:hypothetical protein
VKEIDFPSRWRTFLAVDVTACASPQSNSVFPIRVYPLSLRLRLLTDFLGKNKLAQSALQIAARMNIDEFYRRHGTITRTKALVNKGMSRTAIKQQIMRLRCVWRFEQPD